MSATSQDVLDVLRSIDTSLKALVTRAGGVTPAASAVALPPPHGAVATDADLDGKFGNPDVRFDPRDWTGEPHKGRRFSECQPAFLDMLAETFDYFAGKAEATGELTAGGKPVAQYKRLDAARARGWAARLRNGYQAPTFDTSVSAATPSEPAWTQGGFDADDDIPF